VYSMIVFAYDDVKNEFVLERPFTYVRSWPEKAWWCLTCYAEITDVMGYTHRNELYNRANWKMGSWNARFTGYNEITVATTGTPGRLYVDYWVYIDGEGKFGELALKVIPIVIDFILR